MAYLGRSLTAGNYIKLDDIESQFDGTEVSFNLTAGGSAHYPGSSYSIHVSLGGVVQEPEAAYIINQNQIQFASAPTSGQVLKWDGAKWAPGTDATTGGAGTDATAGVVNVHPAGQGDVEDRAGKTVGRGR